MPAIALFVIFTGILANFDNEKVEPKRVEQIKEERKEK